jgi:hypothetical protein
MMSRFNRWLADSLSRSLEPDEREAVLGDFTESGTGVRRALRELCGLIVRRQALVWRSWRPWLALATLVVPIGLTLSLISRYWASGSAIYLWLYFDNWTWGYLDSPGARRDLVSFGAGLGISYLTLAIWSWTAGFVLGSLSRSGMWVNATLFSVILFTGTTGTATMAMANGNNAAVFSDAFYRLTYPIVVRAVLVVWPALRGMRASRDRAVLGLPRALACAFGVAILTSLAAQSLAGSLTFGWLSAGLPLGPTSGWPLWLVPLAMAWPAAFILGTARWRRREPCVP